MLLFEVMVSCPTSKKVTESSLQMSQALLQWDTTHLIQKLEVIKLFPLRQHSACLNVVNSLLPLVPSLSSCCQCSVKHQPHTTNCPSQYLFLLGSWIHSVAVGFFHASHFTAKTVKHIYLAMYQSLITHSSFTKIACCRKAILVKLLARPHSSHRQTSLWRESPGGAR